MLLWILLLLFGVTASIELDITDDDEPYYVMSYSAARDPGLPCKVMENTIMDCKRRELPRIPQIPDGTYDLFILLSNNISFVANNSFINHPALKDLDLGDNFIKTIDILAFHGLYNLITLSLFDNLLDFIPSKAFDDLIALQELSLYNNLFYHIPQEALSKLPTLMDFAFTLHGSQLFTWENIKSWNMESLFVTGYHGQILRLSNESFVNTRKINSLWLVCDADAEFNAYKPLTELKDFYMECSKLDQLHSVTPTLQHLQLYFSSTCGGIPLKVASTVSMRPLQKFQTLQDLTLGQQISSIEDNAFSWAFTLTTLQLSNNVIEYISPGAFNNLTNLQILNLTSNSLAALPSKALQVFGTSASLTTLDLSDNSIGLQPIPINYTYPFGSSKKLQFILLNSNKISGSFFETYFIIYNLMKMSVANNPALQLSDFKAVFDKFPNMFSLQVEAGEGDMTIPPTGFSSATLQMLIIHTPIIKSVNLIKGALDNFNIIPTFFSKKIEISISSEAYACKMTTC